MPNANVICSTSLWVCWRCRVPTLPCQPLVSRLQLRCAVVARIVCVYDERIRSVLVEHCTGLIAMGALQYHDALIGRILFVDDDSRNFPDSDAPAWASYVNGVSLTLVSIHVPVVHWPLVRTDWEGLVLQWSEQ